MKQDKITSPIHAQHLNNKKQLKKIAALGFRVKNSISYHGLSVNLFNDCIYYNKIRPCGLEPKQMTSLEQVLTQFDNKIQHQKLSQEAKAALMQQFDFHFIKLFKVMCEHF